MLMRNGKEIFCCSCGKHKPEHGAEKEADGHRKICADCVEAQKSDASRNEYRGGFRMADLTVVAIVGAVDALKKCTTRQVCQHLGGSTRVEMTTVSSGMAYLRRLEIIIGEGPKGSPSLFSPPTDKTAAQALAEHRAKIVRSGGKPAKSKMQPQQSESLLWRVW